MTTPIMAFLGFDAAPLTGSAQGKVKWNFRRPGKARGASPTLARRFGIRPRRASREAPEDRYFGPYAG
uniref:hypothetical protein n=1 Tax=Klebsiella pneumoniae TaxID=573 RepID=UPI001954E919